ncbi:hypothetical protein GCM10009678_62230 [Actinomadura kijaniata]
MNRTELVEAVAARAGSDPAAARRHVDAVFEAIMESVASGDRVLVTGFGTFDRVARPARTARNPRTGLPVEVPAGDAPRFRIGQTFKNRVARGADPAVEEIAERAPAEPAAEKTKKPKKKKKTDTKKSGAKKTDAKKSVKPDKPDKTDKRAKKPAKVKAGKGS